MTSVNSLQLKQIFSEMLPVHRCWMGRPGTESQAAHQTLSSMCPCFVYRCSHVGTGSRTVGTLHSRLPSLQYFGNVISIYYTCIPVPGFTTTNLRALLSSVQNHCVDCFILIFHEIQHLNILSIQGKMSSCTYHIQYSSTS